MMVPDLDCSGRGDADVEAFQLVDNQLPDEHGKCPKNKSLSATRTAKTVSPQNLTLPTSPKQLPSNGGFWSPLKGTSALVLLQASSSSLFNRHDPGRGSRN